MPETPLETLQDALSAAGILRGAGIDGPVIVGRARVESADAEILATVDPELDDDDTSGVDLDVPRLVAATERILSVSGPDWWRIVDDTATQVEGAIGDAAVAEATDLRDDLRLVSVAVFDGAVLLRFSAPRQFPDSWILVQLDEELSFEDIAIEPKA